MRAVLDAVGKTGVFDDAVGAAVKKTGLMDTLVELGEKVPRAKEIIQDVKDRTTVALHRLGMDIDKWNLTRDRETEAAKLVEAVNDFTDEEAGQVLQHAASELTHSDTNATIKSNNAVFLKSRNMKLEGMTHPETNTAFEKVRFDWNESSYEIVAAQFENVGQVQLQQEAYLWKRKKQKQTCSLSLWDTLGQTEQAQGIFSESQLRQLEKGQTPTGYVWHHDVVPGVMQLVDADIHGKTGHTGGYAIWGRGAKTGGHDYG